MRISRCNLVQTSLTLMLQIVMYRLLPASNGSLLLRVGGEETSSRIIRSDYPDIYYIYLSTCN